jgi:anaerobic selenocysteine-containing dehydrogenase
MTCDQLVATNCRLCGYLCGLIAHVCDGRVLALEPDPLRYPYDERIVRGCSRCQSNLELLDHPDRINYPLKRAGARGSGDWQRISWTQALDEIAVRLQSLADKTGPETLATSIGGPHSVYWPMHRFLNLFGSPNNLGIGQICWNPAIWVNTLTFGWPLENELDPSSTQCAIIWGMNPAESDNSLLWRTVLEYTRQGGKLIVVDPRQTRTARRAGIWLPLKPGSDASLVMGLLHVIINEKLYDHYFITKWCFGFDELAMQVDKYTPQFVADETGLSPEMIVQTARTFAEGFPASIITGRGIDQIGGNSLPVHRAIACLRAITGNVDVPGAAHLAQTPDFIPEVDLELNHLLSETQRAKQLGATVLQLQTHAGYERVEQQTLKAGGRLPRRYLTSAHPNLIWRAMLTGEPYPIRAMVVMGSNPLSSQADTRSVYQALKSLDLLVALELTRTPTSMLADYVLPIAGGLERSVFQTNAGTANIAYGGKAAVPPYYERRTDFDFWRGLGLRMGQSEYWPWETFEDSLDATLAPLGVSWDEFCKTGLYAPPPDYYKHERVTPTGFATPSGKIELVSQVLAELGAEPLPEPKPLLPVDDKYGLTLISGARVQPFYASAFRQVERLRRMHSVPLVEVGAETAQAHGLTEGDAVWVETKTGRALFRLKVGVMREGVVSVEYGWWYPELSAAEFEPGVLISNANVLTSANFEDCETLLGQWQFNGLPCRIYPAGPDETAFLNDRDILPRGERVSEMECS